MNAAIPTHFCVEFQHTKSKSKPSERFTTSVTQVVNCGKKFNDCGWANKWKWKQVTANSRLIGRVGDMTGWWDNQNSILVCVHVYFFLLFLAVAQAQTVTRSWVWWRWSHYWRKISVELEFYCVHVYFFIFFFCFWLLHKPKQWHDLDCDEGGHIAEEENQLSWKWKLVSNCCCISDRKSRFTDKRSRCSLFQTAVVFTLQIGRADLPTRGVGVACVKLLMSLQTGIQTVYREEGRV